MSKRFKLLNYLGMTASALCLIHCVLTPILIMIFPLLFADSSHNHRYEIFFILLLAMASITFWQGYTLHRSRRSLSMAGVGFILLVCSLLIKTHPAISIVLSTLGAVCMLLAHYWNHKLCHDHGNHNHPHHHHH